MPMLSVDEARARVVAAMPAMGAEDVPLAEADGRVLAEDVAARRTQPPLDVSAMDGYAVRAADLTGTVKLNLIGEAPAGRPFDGAVDTGQAVRIFTGGFVPAGADCVVIQENVVRDGETIRIEKTYLKGDNIRVRGVDFREGDALLAAGRALGPRDLALLAAADVPSVAVRRKPKVAFLATGDELAMLGQATDPLQIIASTGYGLGAYLARWGAVPVDLGLVGDDMEALSASLDRAAGADMLVTLGGASVGDYDLVQDALKAKGMALDFWKIAMRPGKPLMFGRLGDMPVMGLPGNPVSALVCALLFVQPAVRKMVGMAGDLPSIQAVTETALAANGPRQHYVRATLSQGPDGPCVRVLSQQDSSVLSALAVADTLVVRPPNAPACPAGELVRVLPIG